MPPTLEDELMPILDMLAQSEIAFHDGNQRLHMSMLFLVLSVFVNLDPEGPLFMAYHEWLIKQDKANWDKYAGAKLKYIDNVCNTELKQEELVSHLSGVLPGEWLGSGRR